MNYDAYKVHGFTTRMLMGKTSWDFDFMLLYATVNASEDQAVDIKGAWLDGWDAADNLFVEGDWALMPKYDWIMWYGHKLKEQRDAERGDDHGPYLAVIG